MSLILALAGMGFTFRHREKSVIYLVDRSASMHDKADVAATWIGNSIAALSPDTASGVVSLGKKPVVEYPIGLRTPYTGLQAVVDTNFTDLSAGLKLANSMIPTGQGKHIVVATDGKQNRGDALETAKALNRKGVRIDVLPLETTGGSEVEVREVNLPSYLKEGELFNLQASIESTVATPGSIRVMEDNSIILEKDVQLSKGLNKLVWGLKADKSGLHTYRVEIAAPKDGRKENNKGFGITEVTGVPKVLIVEGQAGESSAITQALNSINIKPDVVEAEQMPKSLEGLARYASVALVNVPADMLQEQTMLALENYVKDLGRGLIMVGGEDSFGLGGYYKTPVEKALPVNTNIKGKGEIPNVGLAIVLDKSGSMCHTQNGVTKMDMAKEAALRATEILEPKDSLGVVIFDSEFKWAVDMAPLKKKQEAQDKISAIEPGGGTNMFPAVEAAYKSLKNYNVKIKHIIMLTDGVSKYGGDYDGLLKQLKQDNITLTTVAVGSDSDVGLLTRLAKEGKGRYYYTDRIDTIPKIFAKETFMVSKSYLVQEKFFPVLTGSPTMLPNATEIPYLLGYVATTAKENSEVILTSHKGDPILARWHYGLGRSVAWTSDAKGRWAGEWVNWSQYPQFWGKLISWTLPQDSDGSMRVTTSQEGGKGQVNVDIPNEQRKTHDIVAKVVAPDGTATELNLPAVAPGRYQANFPMEQPGSYFVQVVERSGDQVLRQQTVGSVLPYSPEYQIQPEQRQFLELLAKEGGGKVLHPGDPADLVGKITVPPAWGKVLLWPKLLVFAMLLVPLDIAARRFNLNLKWIQPLWRRIYEKFTQDGKHAAVEQSGLLQSVKMRKKARDKFYHSRSSEPAEFERMVEVGKKSAEAKSLGPQAQQAKPPEKETASKPSGDGNTGTSHTSRLLAAKRRTRK